MFVVVREIMVLHAHTLVDWSTMDRAYQLKLLNGSVWQFNTKSEGLGENNELAWRLVSSPPGTVFESLNRVHASLNAHLEQIRKELRERGAGSGSGAIVTIPCGHCHFRPVSIPGGICRACREAQGATDLGRYNDLLLAEQAQGQKALMGALFGDPPGFFACDHADTRDGVCRKCGQAVLGA